MRLVAAEEAEESDSCTAGADPVTRDTATLKDAARLRT